MRKKSVFLALLFTLLSPASLSVVFLRTVMASPSTSVYVRPQRRGAFVDQIVTVYIAVSDVNNLWTWQAGMTFNPNVLECLSFEEGPFLATGGTTLWQPGTINNTSGVITFYGCTLTGGSTPVSGSGNLATLKFRSKNLGNSTLHLTDVILVDPVPKQIPADTTDGMVRVIAPVGGVRVLVDKFGLLAPYIVHALAAIAITTGAVCLRRRWLGKAVVRRQCQSKEHIPLSFPFLVVE